MFGFITFVNKDLPLINKFIELFGGRLRFKKKENAIVWIINTHKELVSLINLIIIKQTFWEII